MPSIQTSITKTAHDALLAKQSAVRAGYCIGDDLYRELLLHQSSSSSSSSSSSKMAKQSPLVHAGYAVRVACVLHTLQSFLSYHSDATMVILGAGLDVTGLWAALRSSHVIELDVPEICHIKAEQWNDSVHFMNDRCKTITGNIVLQAKTTTGGSYTLLAADLRNRMEWETELRLLLDEHSSRACLVLSELVMTYLEDCDPILEFCSQLPNCCFVAYEPFGPNDTNDKQSVLEEYKRAYLSKFKDKLDKGNATNSTSVMYPLGGCAETVTSRLQQYFSRAYVTTAGQATSSQGIVLRIPEPFDESIALTLHLQSYMLAWAFSSSHESLLQRIMCPWSIGYVPKQIPGHPQIWITPLELEDEAAIRNLFSQSYQHLFEHHPSIQKMVQTALKKDMALSTDASTSSQMRQWFREREGDFFVAVQRHPRTVLGGIAVRKCATKEARTFGTADVFELHRLVVHPDWYQRGIGRALLDSIQKEISVKTRNNRPILLTATTFAGLQGANHFYSACGFGSPQPFQLGDLPMHLYQKEILSEEKL